MAGIDHCYYFFGFSSDRKCPQSKKKNDLNLVESTAKSTAITRIGKFYRCLPPNTT